MTPEQVNERLDAELKYVATRDWVEAKLQRARIDQERARIDQERARLDRQSKLLNCAGLLAFGVVWGFVMAEFLFLRK
jgi:hypothetical protein